MFDDSPPIAATRGDMRRRDNLWKYLRAAEQKLGSRYPGHWLVVTSLGRGPAGFVTDAGHFDAAYSERLSERTADAPALKGHFLTKLRRHE